MPFKMTIALAFTLTIVCVCSHLTGLSLAAPRPLRSMELLDRGVIAINQGEGKVYLGWRLFGTDPETIAFNVYRATEGGKPVKLNNEPIKTSTNLVDAHADLTKANSWFVRPLLRGK